MTLHLVYDDGAKVVVDLGSLVKDGGVFAPLATRGFFDQLQIGRGGRSVRWPNGADLDADTLRMDPQDERHPGGYRVLERDVPQDEGQDPFSAEVARAIRESGLTQTAIAERMGVPQSTVARLASPSYRGHSAESLRRLAQALEARVEVRIVPVASTAAVPPNPDEVVIERRPATGSRGVDETKISTETVGPVKAETRS